ncbi:hypothetical protein WP3W18E01_28710 [Raoultella ornithinolytica]|nr:hypothetical protein WP3W18E01_28710 [Raoultella ornithinolytica]
MSYYPSIERNLSTLGGTQTRKHGGDHEGHRKKIEHVGRQGALSCHRLPIGHDGFSTERNAGDKAQRGVSKTPCTAGWLSSLQERGPDAVPDSHNLFCAQALSGNRVNVDSKHRRCHTQSRDTDNTPSIKKHASSPVAPQHMAMKTNNRTAHLVSLRHRSTG